MLQVENSRAARRPGLQQRPGAPAIAATGALDRAGHAHERGPHIIGELGRHRRIARPSSGRIDRPADDYTEYEEGNLFRVSVPANWQESAGNNAVTFTPRGASGTVNGQNVFTHGVEIGVARNETHELRTATDELIQSLAQSNPRLSRPSSYERMTIGGLEGLRTQLSNVSDVTGGDERVFVSTALLNDGTLFYLLGVAPRAEFSDYNTAFRNIAESIQFVR